LRAAQPVIAAAVRAERQAGAPVPCRKVVNISSLAGTEGNPGQANYSAAKAGVLGLTRTLAKEWGRYNVTVNSVAFGMIRTRLTEQRTDGDGTVEIEGRPLKLGVPPEVVAGIEERISLGRAGTPADAAGSVYLLCSPESDYITGETLICSGGLNL
jgi:3-oxoacyl-[acyl-carrier protein] reductase